MPNISQIFRVLTLFETMTAGRDDMKWENDWHFDSKFFSKKFSAGVNNNFLDFHPMIYRGRIWGETATFRDIADLVT